MKRFTICATICMFLSGVCFAAWTLPAAAYAAPAPPQGDSGYERGVDFVTDGGVPGGPCLRLDGRLTSPDFFAGLRRAETPRGVEFRRGPARVTHFPEEMQLEFLVRDIPCPENIEQGGPQKNLTRDWMNTLKIAFYWKRGVALRPVSGISDKTLTVERIEPYDALNAGNLPERFRWRFHCVVATAGVPLTDHLVIVLRTPDGRFVARVAARL